MILHTVNKSPYSSPCLTDCIALCSEGDAILLIEDGVYAAQDAYSIAAENKVYALQADIEARGLSGKLAANVTVIDDSGFVMLATQHEKVVSWY